MPRTPIDLPSKIRNILSHVEPLPPEANTPLSHFRRTGADLHNLLYYTERNFDTIKSLKPAVRERHLTRLHMMVVVNLIESFERYLKEAAAACVDLLGSFVLDDRFDGFRVQGSAIAVHFGTDTLGRALCESSTWLDTASVNKRFRALLADPFEEGKFFLFPNEKRGLAEDRARFETLELAWQIRHTIVHNVGVITQSDAVKLRLLVKAAIPSPRQLVPTRDDVRYLKRFLDETAEIANQRIGQRLAELLTTFYAGDATLFTPQEMADRISMIFGFTVQVENATGTLPP